MQLIALPLDVLLSRTNRRTMEQHSPGFKKKRHQLICLLKTAEMNTHTDMHMLFNSHQTTYQATVFESIEHLKVATSLTPLQVAHVLPESVYTSQGHQPLGVQLPGVPEQSKASVSGIPCR